MPTYEYACKACGHSLEAVQSFTDDPLTECPECGSALRKVYAPIGIVLKGSGFYKTDSRAAAKAAKGSNGSGTKKEADSKSESSSDSSSSESTAKKETPSSSDGKGGDGKSGDGKSGEGKGGKDAKPAAATAS
jgi:putative FmdB family regulatory protein